MTPEICTVAANGDLNRVIELLDERPANIKAVDEDSRTPLLCACAANQLKVAEFLLKKNADYNVQDEFGMTPLLISVASGYDELVQLLIGIGADPNAQNSSGQTALHYSASKSRADLCQLLLNHKANSRLVNSIHQTSLHRAAVKGAVGIILLLLSSDIGLLKLKDDEGNTALHLACEENNADAAVALIQTYRDADPHADLSTPNKQGFIPIDLCSDPKAKAYIISHIQS